MQISVVNLASSGRSDNEVIEVIRAINRQISEDFAPHWHWSATLRLEGSQGKLDLKGLLELRGDGIVYVAKSADDPEVEGALGYHDANFKGVPYGVVFIDLAKKLNEPWSVTMSHECLELIGDANVNTFAAGPHPDPGEKGRIVFHWYEMCDAVQAETYKIDDVDVSNFVLPLYFTPNDEHGSRNDFLGTTYGKGAKLKSFGVNPGGYVGFFDPEKNDHATYEADARAKKRRSIKGKLPERTRRGLRYEHAGKLP